jgi:hypothetical protein
MYFSLMSNVPKIGDGFVPGKLQPKLSDFDKELKNGARSLLFHTWRHAVNMHGDIKGLPGEMHALSLEKSRSVGGWLWRGGAVKADDSLVMKEISLARCG